MAKQKVTQSKRRAEAVSVIAVPLAVPQKHKIEYYDYHEVAKYLEDLHKKDFRDYAGKRRPCLPSNPNLPYQDFWHIISDCNEVVNGGFIHLPDWDYYMNSARTESWQKEIMQFFHDFLGDDYREKMLASW